MIKAIIVDDEAKSRENLNLLIGEFCQDVVVIASVDNIYEATLAINKHNPDLVFFRCANAK